MSIGGYFYKDWRRICTIKLTRIALDVPCCWKWWVLWTLDEPFSLIRIAPMAAMNCPEG